jgi:hypothetical protein
MSSVAAHSAPGGAYLDSGNTSTLQRLVIPFMHSTELVPALDAPPPDSQALLIPDT